MEQFYPNIYQSSKQQLNIEQKVFKAKIIIIIQKIHHIIRGYQQVIKSSVQIMYYQHDQIDITNKNINKQGETWSFFVYQINTYYNYFLFPFINRSQSSYHRVPTANKITKIKIQPEMSSTPLPTSSKKQQPKQQHITYTSSIPESYTSWIIRDCVLREQHCLSSNDKTKVMRGFRKSSNLGIVLKISLVFESDLKQYQVILKNASKFYSLKKGSHDFIIQLQPVTSYVDRTDVPVARYKEDQQLNLYSFRPYFEGRNLHQSVYIHSIIGYKPDQFPTFIKHSIQLLSSISTLSCHPTFLPTLDNIYLDKQHLNANLTSMETFMFLKHKTQHLTIQNFKQLYVLLKKDAGIFVDWEKMQAFMREEMLCRAILVMWFCFMTVRSPIEMIRDISVNQEQLYWDKLLISSSEQAKPNQSSKIVQMIGQVGDRWQKLLNEPLNKKCLEAFSQKIWQKIGQKLVKQQKYVRDLEKEKNFFYLLYSRVFSKQEFFGWKQLFAEKHIFMYLVQTSRDHSNEQQQIIDQQKQLSQPYHNKIQSSKKSLIYIHKYFLTKDITSMQPTQLQATEYIKQVNFQTYLPIKIGLPIEYILSYTHWFQIFFVESGDNRPQVYKAASLLFQLVERQCGEILKMVKGCQLFHLKRVVYLLGMKLALSKEMKQLYQMLEEQVVRFVDKSRPFQAMLQSFGSQLQRIANNIVDKPSINAVKVQFIDEFSKKEEIYSSSYLILFFIAFLAMQLNQTQTSISQDSEGVWKNIKPIYWKFISLIEHQKQFLEKNSPISQKFADILMEIQGKIKTIPEGQEAKQVETKK